MGEVFVFASRDDEDAVVGEDLPDSFVGLPDEAFAGVQDVRKLFGALCVADGPETVADTSCHDDAVCVMEWGVYGWCHNMICVGSCSNCCRIY